MTKLSSLVGTVFDAIVAIAPRKPDSNQLSHRSVSTLCKITDRQIARRWVEDEFAEGRRNNVEAPKRKVLVKNIALVVLSGAPPTSHTFEFLEIFCDNFDKPNRQPTKSITMPPKKAARPAQENISLGPQVRDGELVFGVARIFASFNDTFVHVTDLSYVDS